MFWMVMLVKKVMCGVKIMLFMVWSFLISGLFFRLFCWWLVLKIGFLFFMVFRVVKVSGLFFKVLIRLVVLMIGFWLVLIRLVFGFIWLNLVLVKRFLEVGFKFMWREMMLFCWRSFFLEIYLIIFFIFLWGLRL